MKQAEIVTNIGKYLFSQRRGNQFQIGEIIGVIRNRDDTFIQSLSARSQYTTTTAFADAVKATYKVFNPAKYDTDNVVIWVYVEKYGLETLYIGFSRELTSDEWITIRQMLKVSFVDIKEGQFGILTF
jgi:hypothetical protein